MAEAWLNSPCTDPLGRVFARDGRIFRALFRESADQALRTLEHPAVQALMQEGLVVRMRRSGLELEGYGPVLEAEKAAFDVPCGRFSFGALRQAALDWLEITRRLLPEGLALTDAHYGNFMLFGANRPRWIDFGSIRSAAVLPEETPFKAFRMFWTGMLAPLLMLASKPQQARLARLAIADFPLQGPRMAGSEAPLSAASQVALPLDDFQDLSTDAALRRAVELLPAPRAPEELEVPALEDRLIRHASAALGGTTTVACIGAETFLGAAKALAGKDVVVVEPVGGRVELLERSIARSLPCRSVALYEEHCINRLFRRERLTADVVLAIDPMRALAHDSAVESANIADTLSAIARRRVVVIAPHSQRAATRRMLEPAFGAVDEEHFGWPYGGWDVLVCAQA